MQQRAFWLSTSVFAIGGMFIACSSSTTETLPGTPSDADTGASDGGDEADPVAPADAGGGTCALPDGLTSGRATCDGCLLKRCCLAFKTCFDDPKCADMNDCLDTCQKKLGITDAGADCARTCAEQDKTAAEELLDMRDCQSNRCGTECHR
jgi:hypothetical protein